MITESDDDDEDKIPSRRRRMAERAAEGGEDEDVSRSLVREIALHCSGKFSYRFLKKAALISFVTS